MAWNWNWIRVSSIGFEASGAKSPASTTSASPYLIFVLSITLAMRAKPPFGVWQPQGVTLPTASDVLRTGSVFFVNAPACDVPASRQRARTRGRPRIAIPPKRRVENRNRPGVAPGPVTRDPAGAPLVRDARQLGRVV